MAWRNAETEDFRWNSVRKPAVYVSEHQAMAAFFSSMCVHSFSSTVSRIPARVEQIADGGTGRSQASQELENVASTGSASVCRDANDQIGHSLLKYVLKISLNRSKDMGRSRSYSQYSSISVTLSSSICPDEYITFSNLTVFQHSM